MYSWNSLPSYKARERVIYIHMFLASIIRKRFSMCVFHAAANVFFFWNNKWLDPCGVDEIIDNWVGTAILWKIQCHWTYKAHRLLIFTLLSCSFYFFVASSLFSFRFRWLSTWFHVYLLDWKYNKYLSFRMNTFWAREWESKRSDSVYHHFRWIAKNSCFRAIFSSAHE